MINYICAALCAFSAALLVVILRQRQKIRHLKENDPGRMLNGFVIKLKGRQHPAATEDTKHIPKPVFNIVEKVVENRELLKSKMTPKEWALNELKRIENTCTDEDSLRVQKMVTKNVMDILTVFDNQDHSGFSANYTINLVVRLLRRIPLTPLTGEEDEWYEPYGPDNTQQNKRCTKVFRRNFDNSTAYNIRGRVFSNDGKTWWTNRNSSVPVAFPYVVPVEPERVYLEKEEKNDE